MEVGENKLEAVASSPSHTQRHRSSLVGLGYILQGRYLHSLVEVHEVSCLAYKDKGSMNVSQGDRKQVAELEVSNLGLASKDLLNICIASA